MPEGERPTGQGYGNIYRGVWLQAPCLSSNRNCASTCAGMTRRRRSTQGRPRNAPAKAPDAPGSPAAARKRPIVSRRAPDQGRRSQAHHRAVRNSSREQDIVLDPFAGAGSTLIACERLGRRARLIELEPAYVDVIVQRWEALTGATAILDQDAKSFPEVAAERTGSVAPV